MYIKNIFSILLIIFVVNICYPQLKKKWEIVKNKNSLTSYEEFVKMYPNSKFANMAKQKIDSINYQFADSINTLASYYSFLDKQLLSEYSEIAITKFNKILFSTSPLSEQELNKQYDNLTEFFSPFTLVDIQYNRFKNILNEIQFERVVNDCKMLIFEKPNSKYFYLYSFCPDMIELSLVECKKNPSNFLSISSGYIPDNCKIKKLIVFYREMDNKNGFIFEEIKTYINYKDIDSIDFFDKNIQHEEVLFFKNNRWYLF